MLAAVRVIVPPGIPWELPLAPGYGFTGPAEFVFESVNLDLGVHGGVTNVTSGEYIIGGASEALQVMPYMREEMTIVFPLLIGLLVIITFHWLGRRFLR